MSGSQDSVTDLDEQLEAAYEDYVHAEPLPPDHELDEAECHNCGQPWDEDEWTEREVAPGSPSLGQTWKYRCPGCGEESFEVGT